MILALSGVDCSGKSSQIQLLQKRLNGTVAIIWGRYGYTPGIEFLKSVVRGRRGKSVDLKWSSVNNPDDHQTSIINKIWSLLCLLDFICFYAFYVRYKATKVDHIILDRFILDFIVDYEFRHGRELSRFVISFMRFFLVRPDRYFFLSVDADTSLKRMQMKNDPFPESQKDISRKIGLFELHSEICKKIEAYDDLAVVNEKLFKEI